jgi:hypothetical protein
VVNIANKTILVHQAGSIQKSGTIIAKWDRNPNFTQKLHAMIRSFKAFFVLLFGFSSLLLVSCEKEYSEENGQLPGGGGSSSGTSAFTYDGAPGNCTTPLVSGTYQVGTALGAANTVEISVNVTTAGTYNISTSTANGMSFSGSGTFAATGAQTILLQGTGTPTSATTSAFVPGGNGCTFLITSTAGSSTTDFLRCKINGALVNFNYLAEAIQLAADTLSIGGGVSAVSTEVIEMQLIGGTSLIAGTYKEQGAVAGATTYVETGYVDQSVGIWYVDMNAPTPRTNPYTVVITNITATRVEGTFFGTLFDAFSPATLQITEGEFSLPRS